MKTNQVVSFFKGFKFSKIYLLMKYKLNKIQLGTQALH